MVVKLPGKLGGHPKPAIEASNEPGTKIVPRGWRANPDSSAAEFKNGRRFHCLIPGATFREQETKQRLQAGGVCRVPKKLLIAPHLNQPLVPKLVEMMRERGRCDIELRLNIAYDHTLGWAVISRCIMRSRGSVPIAESISANRAKSIATRFRPVFCWTAAASSR